MQLTGQAGRHLSHPEQSSGMITTSGPWLKMAPNVAGQCAQAGVAVDALRHLDAQRGVPPLGVALARRRCAPGLSGCAGHRRMLAASPRIDPGSRAGGLAAWRPAAGERRHTDQGLERKQQLLDARRVAVRQPGYGPTAHRRHLRGRRRGQGPLLLVLREQGSPCSPSWCARCASSCAGPRPRRWTPTPTRSPACARAPRPRCGSWPQHVALLRPPRGRAQRPAGRRGAAGERRRVRPGRRPPGAGGAGRRPGARRPRPDPAGHRRAGRGRPVLATTTAPVDVAISIDELAQFVGQWTIQALAAVPSPTAG